MERRQVAARKCAELMMEHEDWKIINPFHIYDRLKKELLEDGFYEEPTYDDIMKADLAQLQRCDAAYFMSGWEKSEGCKREMQYCIDNNIAVASEKK